MRKCSLDLKLAFFTGTRSTLCCTDGERVQFTMHSRCQAKKCMKELSREMLNPILADGTANLVTLLSDPQSNVTPNEASGFLLFANQAKRFLECQKTLYLFLSKSRLREEGCRFSTINLPTCPCLEFISIKCCLQEWVIRRLFLKSERKRI